MDAHLKKAAARLVLDGLNVQYHFDCDYVDHCVSSRTFNGILLRTYSLAH